MQRGGVELFAIAATKSKQPGVVTLAGGVVLSEQRLPQWFCHDDLPFRIRIVEFDGALHGLPNVGKRKRADKATPILASLPTHSIALSSPGLT